MNYRAKLSPLIMLGLIGSLAGCRSVPLNASGTMQATFVAGQFNMIVNADAARTAQAARQAFAQMEMFVVQSESKTFSAKLAVRTKDDRKIRLVIREINSRQSEIGIRVDAIGDEPLSRRLYERIETNIGG